VRKVKLWMRDFDGIVEPMAKGMNSLRGYLDHELPQGIAFLTEVEKIMEGYVEAGRAVAGAVERPGVVVPEEEGG
jgi:hypothetical protein